MVYLSVDTFQYTSFVRQVFFLRATKLIKVPIIALLKLFVCQYFPQNCSDSTLPT